METEWSRGDNGGGRDGRTGGRIGGRTGGGRGGGVLVGIQQMRRSNRDDECGCFSGGT
jgi:hypothetical protein